jgi:hypothetical protein
MHKQTKAKVCVVIPLSTVLSVEEEVKGKEDAEENYHRQKDRNERKWRCFPLILHENWYFLEKPLLISVIVSNM